MNDRNEKKKEPTSVEMDRKSSRQVHMRLTQWRAKDAEFGSNEPALSSDGAGWIDVEAPGDIYMALHRSGRLPDPFAGQNEEACAWVAQRDWWWATRFDAPPREPEERLLLTFHGLDTFATLWLNGRRIGETDNMFRGYEFDVTDHLAASENRIVIRFAAPDRHLEDRAPLVWAMPGGGYPRTKRNLMRKAQFGWGWDWGPSFPTVGLWRPVTLSTVGGARLRNTRFSTLALSEGGAEARIEVEVAARPGEGEYEAEVELFDPGNRSIAVSRFRLVPGAGDMAGKAEFLVHAPRLWWTHDLGEPALHRLEVRLLERDRIVDSQEQTVGIRTIALDQSPDPEEEGASHFRFILNGRPVFARGACWIPASSFVAELGEAEYRPLIEAAVDSRMNMLRVWGGGIYEHDAFYDLCDRAGVLVWQDFMFACAPYPDADPAFVENVREELVYQVRRLRHHASLALWCGNNEAQAIHSFVKRVDKSASELAGADLYDRVMPAVVAAEDATTPYWPGSPSGGPHPNSMLAGDVHHWTVWHGVPLVPRDVAQGRMDGSPAGVVYTRYAEDMARFVSEFGIQASPAAESWQRILDPSERSLGHAAMHYRIKDEPNDKVNAMLETTTGLPSTLQEYVDFTMINQAEGLKFGIEHFRRRMPHCSGALIWQLNDCWPCVSWSVIDHDGHAKAAYFYTRRAFSPVIASFREVKDGGIELWVTNEGWTDLVDEALVELVSFAGPVVDRARYEVRVPANSSRAVGRMPADWAVADPSRFLHVAAAGGTFCDNRHFLAPIKDLDRPASAPNRVHIEQAGPHELAVTISADIFSYFTNIVVPHGHTRFSDNFFDMRAGSERRISVTNLRVLLKPDDVVVRNV